jgi:hypothetical protein
VARKAPVRAVLRVPALKPRNPLSVAARKRVAGAHGPSRKAERAAAKVRLKKGPDEL